MSTRNNQGSRITNRRRQVDQLRLKGLTAQQIVDELESSGIVSQTGKPYKLRTIISDLVELHMDQVARANEITRMLRRKAIAEGGEGPHTHNSVDNASARIVFVHHPISEYLCGLVSVVQGPDITQEERAIAQEKFKDWVNYAQKLADRMEVEPELPILDAEFYEIA